MRRFLKVLLFFLFGVITILALTNIRKYLQKQQQYKYWVECMEAGSRSPEDCKRCDILFQPEGERFTMPSTD